MAIKRQRGFTIVHLIVVIVLFLVLLAFLMPMHHISHESSYRVKCQSNLSQMGKALLLYSNENKGLFPQTHYIPDAPISLTNDGFANANPFAVAPTPGTTNNIPAALFQLVRTEDMTPEVFTCPQGTAQADLMANMAGTSRGNFTGDGKPGGSVLPNVSYSFANVYPSNAAVKRGSKTFITAYSSDFAIAADVAPIGPNDPIWQSIKVGVPRSTMIKGNSKAHDQDGQNVLYADGHAEFQQTSLCGTQNDNIYTVNRVSADGLLSPDGSSASGDDPASDADSVLLIHE